MILHLLLPTVGICDECLKYVRGVKRSCSNIATLGELSEFPLYIHGLVSMLSFWHRTAQMHDDTLVKQALNIITNYGQNSSECAATVKFLLKYLDMENYFANLTIVDTKKFTSLCFTKFKKVFIDQWEDGDIERTLKYWRNK